MKRNRKRMGCMTFTQEVDVELYMRDIISSLNDFESDELEDLRDAIDKEIGIDNNPIFDIENLEDEQKIKILKEFFDKYSWEELEKIKKSL